MAVLQFTSVWQLHDKCLYGLSERHITIADLLLLTLKK